MDARRCGDYLQAARAGDQKALNAALTSLHPDVVSYIRSLRSRLANLYDETAEDEDVLTQNVMLKLASFDTAPNRAEGRPPEVTLRAWIKLTATRLLLNIKRSKRDDLVSAGTDDDGDETDFFDRQVNASFASKTEDVVGTKQSIREYRELLRVAFPRCLDLYERTLEEESADDASAAIALGLTVANLQQMRARMRRYLGTFIHLQREPHATDEEVMVALGVKKPTDDIRRILVSVRNFLAQRSIRGTP